MAQSFYEMAYLSVFYAHQYKAGKKAPRTIITPSYAVVQSMLTKGIPDDFDVPGRAAKLGWTRAL
jgi:ribose transport system substrate-binding protein